MGRRCSGRPLKLAKVINKCFVTGKIQMPYIADAKTLCQDTICRIGVQTGYVTHTVCVKESKVAIAFKGPAAQMRGYSVGK